MKKFFILLSIPFLLLGCAKNKTFSIQNESSSKTAKVDNKEVDNNIEKYKYQLEDKLVYLQQQSLGGLTKYLTMKILGELDFIIPPMEKQIEFEEFAKQVDKSKVAVQKALDKTQLLFDSLMQKYFG